MTDRQVVGFAVFCALLLGLGFFCWWLPPLLDYRAPEWVFYVLGPLIGIGWVSFYRSDFAKRRPPPDYKR